MPVRQDTATTTVTDPTSVFHRLEPLLLNWLDQGGTWGMAGASESTVRAREQGVVAAATRLGGATDRMVREALLRGWIQPDA